MIDETLSASGTPHTDIPDASRPEKKGHLKTNTTIQQISDDVNPDLLLSEKPVDNAISEAEILHSVGYRYSVDTVTFDTENVQLGNGITPQTKAFIEREFCQEYEDFFTVLTNSRGWRLYGESLEQIKYQLFREELFGMALARDRDISPHYYDELNGMLAEALVRRQDPDTGRYGGYSDVQIAADIDAFLAKKGIKDDDKNHPYRLKGMSKKAKMIIAAAFDEYRKTALPRYLEAVDPARHIPLICIDNDSNPDPVLSGINKSRKACGMPVNKDARYLSFPVAEGAHIADDIEERNIHTMSALIAQGYGGSGGYSVLLGAGTGIGKTYFVVKKLAPILGELTGAPVYMLTPTRPQVEQLKQMYGVNVCYADDDIEGEGTNPSIRAYIYKYATRIPATRRTTSGEVKPVILIIDEVHSLTTEKYMGETLKDIIKKAKEILSAGGVVIGMTASTETILPTIHYNNLSGYDLVVNVFRVSSTNSLMTDDGVKHYPDYGYDDAEVYGIRSGIIIENTIPVDKIVVAYQQSKDSNIVSAVLSQVIDLAKVGRKVVVEYNNIDLLNRLRVLIEDEGYKVAICHSADKDYEYDPDAREKRYKNKAIDSIINRGSINFTDIDVVLTTKLLEFGTSIDDITVDGASKDALDTIKKGLTTIYVVEKKERMNLEAFEQFSGRIRFQHDTAMLLTVAPVKRGTGKPKKADSNRRLGKAMSSIKSLAWKLRKSVISRLRLSFTDLSGREDMPEGLPDSGKISSETIAEAQAQAVKDIYTDLMYDQDGFEEVVKERYQYKSVEFIQLGKAEHKTRTRHETLSIEDTVKVRKAIVENLQDPTQRARICCMVDRANSEPEVLKLLTDVGRSTYKNQARATLRHIAMLQDITEMSDNEKTTSGNQAPEKLSNETVAERIAVAIQNKNKTDITKLYASSIAASIQYLAQYDISRAVISHALRFGSKPHAKDIEDLADECLGMLPSGMSAGFRDKIRALMISVFSSDEVKRVHSVVRICHPYRDVDLSFYAEKVTLTKDQLQEYKTAFQATVFAMHPEQLHQKDTRSGATFEAMTDADAYFAAVGERMDPAKGLEAWVNRRLTRERAVAILTSYNRQMIKQGLRPERDAQKGIAAVVRTFAGAFKYDKGKTKKGTNYIELREVRTSIHHDYMSILSLDLDGIWAVPVSDLPEE